MIIRKLQTLHTANIILYVIAYPFRFVGMERRSRNTTLTPQGYNDLCVSLSVYHGMPRKVRGHHIQASSCLPCGSEGSHLFSRPRCKYLFTLSHLASLGILFSTYGILPSMQFYIRKTCLYPIIRRFYQTHRLYKYTKTSSQLGPIK